MRKQLIRLGCVALAATLLVAFSTADDRPTKVYLIGDSTIAQKETNKYPETGWGMPFRYFFDSTIVVDNRAKNGRSSKSFRAEQLWQPVMDSLRAGDYVLIQFGHNDESKNKGERYSSPEEFSANLVRYVQETRSKKAIPVLITPVARRQFDSLSHQAKESHGVYSDLVRTVAKQQDVPLIDLDAKSIELLNDMGEEQSKLLFLQLAAGEHPNYPDGVTDNTHFSELGARKMAQLVLQELRKLNTGLEKHIVHP